MKLSGLSMSDLRSLQQEIEREIKKREKDEIAKAREQIMAIAQRIGVPLKDLITEQSRGKTPSSKRGKAQIRYRHPSDASLEWSGRGRQPKWVKDWIASGQSLDDLSA